MPKGTHTGVPVPQDHSFLYHWERAAAVGATLCGRPLPITLPHAPRPSISVRRLEIASPQLKAYAGRIFLLVTGGKEKVKVA